MFPGCAGPSCPRVRVFNMRSAPGIVNGHSTTYGVFVLGQSLDVGIVEKRQIRQIRKCPDENRPAGPSRMVGSGGIPYHTGYGARSGSAQPCRRPSGRVGGRLTCAWRPWGYGDQRRRASGRPALPDSPAPPALSPVQPHVQGRWEAGLSTASRGAQAGCMEGWVPPSRTPEERGCQT